MSFKKVNWLWGMAGMNATEAFSLLELSEMHRIVLFFSCSINDIGPRITSHNDLESWAWCGKSCMKVATLKKNDSWASENGI